MSYFPQNIMPADNKKDIMGPSGTMLSADFNRRGDEIIAIEQFLGTGPASAADENAVASGSKNPQNVLGVMANLVDAMNGFSDGMASSSGYLQSSRSMIFPENAHATFLTTAVGPTDTTINVNSTIGFPSSGVITILNDVISYPDRTTFVQKAIFTVPDSTVEWIRYAGITETSFVNCQRGYLGTTIGTHNGILVDGITENNSTSSYAILPNTTTANSPSRCMTLNLAPAQQLCERVYPGWKAKTSFDFPAFELTGSLLDITRTIRRNPESFDLSPDFLGDTFSDVQTAASANGILATDPITGNLILRSNDPNYQAMHQLTWIEASGFVSDLKAANRIFQLKGPTDWIASVNFVGGGRDPVPVFQGQMAVQWGLSAATLNPLPPNTTVQQFPSEIERLSIYQSADGRLGLLALSEFAVSIANSTLDQAIIQYRTFFVPSLISSSQRNDL